MRAGNHEDTLVYSSDPRTRASKTIASASRSVQTESVRVWLEKKGRNGKPVCIVRGLGLDRDALAVLATRLKRACGTGGSAKDGEIIIQGDHRDAIVTLLGGDGFRVKKAGG